MQAAVYYTFFSHGDYDQPAIRAKDRIKLSLLLKKIEDDGNMLCGIYMSDRTAPFKISLRTLIKRDAVSGRFEILYLYLYNTPVSISAEKLLNILDLPVDGPGSIFD